VLVDDPFDLVDDLCSLPDEMLSEVSELPNLGLFGRGGKNTSDAEGALAALEPFAVVPKEFAKGVGISFVGLVDGGVVGLNHDDFVTKGFVEFFKQPIVKAADFDDGHKAAMSPGFFAEFAEKIVNIRMKGLDLSFLHDISLFVPKVDGKLIFVLVDTKVQHDLVSVG
jgi:hypothetical protein